MEQSESFKHDPCCSVLPFMTVLVLRVWRTLDVVCSPLLQGEPWQPILCLHSFEITTILKNYHGPWSTAWYDAKNDEEKILKDSSERCGGKRGYGIKGHSRDSREGLRRAIYRRLRLNYIHSSWVFKARHELALPSEIQAKHSLIQPKTTLRQKTPSDATKTWEHSEMVVTICMLSDKHWHFLNTLIKVVLGKINTRRVFIIIISAHVLVREGLSEHLCL